jgi:quercetin dioxygenase-like cupin family protein
MIRGRAWFFVGVLTGAGGVALGQPVAGAAAARAAAQQTAGPRSSSKVVLENARVRVKDVTFAPGEGNPGMHTHGLAHVGVILTPGSLTFTEPGKPAETVKFDAGSVGFREADVTHQVTNPGTGPMRVIEVELK